MTLVPEVRERCMTKSSAMEDPCRAVSAFGRQKLRVAFAICIAAASTLGSAAAHAIEDDACRRPAPQVVLLPPDRSPPPSTALVAALTDTARGDMRGLDARRRPGTVITFSGAKPGDRVAELIPGAGYFSRIFARLVGPSGHVYLIWPTEYLAEVGASEIAPSRALAVDPHYGNIEVLEQAAASFSTPEKVDLVFTAQNFHDYPDAFMGKIDPGAISRQVYTALKPGGVFLIIDHAATGGSSLRDTEKLHRIDANSVRRSVTAAGFVFDAESDALRNAADAHTQPVFCPSIRGHTDQFILRFHKPA